MVTPYTYIYICVNKYVYLRVDPMQGEYVYIIIINYIYMHMHMDAMRREYTFTHTHEIINI